MKTRTALMTILMVIPLSLVGCTDSGKVADNGASVRSRITYPDFEQMFDYYTAGIKPHGGPKDAEGGIPPMSKSTKSKIYERLVYQVAYNATFEDLNVETMTDYELQRLINRSMVSVWTDVEPLLEEWCPERAAEKERRERKTGWYNFWSSHKSS
jgi:hypothetical protein